MEREGKKETGENSGTTAKERGVGIKERKEKKEEKKGRKKREGKRRSYGALAIIRPLCDIANAFHPSPLPSSSHGLHYRSGNENRRIQLFPRKKISMKEEKKRKKKEKEKLAVDNRATLHSSTRRRLRREKRRRRRNPGSNRTKLVKMPATRRCLQRKEEKEKEEGEED